MKTNLILTVLVIAGCVVVAGFIGYTVYVDIKGPTSDNELETATSTPVGISANGGDYTVEQIPTTGGTPIKPPSLDRPIYIDPSLSADVKTTLRTILEGQIALLKQEPKRLDLWLQLGVNRKVGGDYDGAREAWNYVVATGPEGTQATAYGNLGDLYMNFLKDYPKAEQSYLNAVSRNPQAIGYYRDLFTLYFYLYKTNTSAAADILERGLKANPGNADLLTLKAKLTE